MLTGLFRVDAIKKAARQEAWYRNNDPEHRTYNLWGRVNTRPRKAKDEENDPSTPIQHVSTENEITSPAEDRRRLSAHEANKGYTGPRKSGTFPQGPAEDFPQSSKGIDENIYSDSSEPSKDSAESTDIAATKEQSSTIEGLTPQDGPRHRKRDKFMPW